MKTVTLSQNILDILENNGFYVGDIEERDEEFYIEISQGTPAGEDWWETIWFDGTDEGFIEAINERVGNFDVDSEAGDFVAMRGQYGIPDDIETLLDDAKWKQATLEALEEDLNTQEAEIKDYQVTFSITNGEEQEEWTALVEAECFDDAVEQFRSDLHEIGFYV